MKAKRKIVLAFFVVQRKIALNLAKRDFWGPGQIDHFARNKTDEYAKKEAGQKIRRKMHLQIKSGKRNQDGEQQCGIAKRHFFDHQDGGRRD